MRDTKLINDGLMLYHFISETADSIK